MNEQPKTFASGEAENTPITGNSGPVQSIRMMLPKDTRDLLIATLLAVSIVVNIVMYFSYRNLTQTVDLDRYDDNTFINGRFAELSAQVKADHDLIQAYGLQKAVREK